MSRSTYLISGLLLVAVLVLGILLINPLFNGNNIKYSPPTFILPEIYGQDIFRSSYGELSYQLGSPSYSLPVDLNTIENYRMTSDLLSLRAASMLSDNGFVVLHGGYKDLPKAYEKLIERGYPIYITTDTVLYLYHTLFDKILSMLEEKYFYDNLTVILKEAADEAYKIYRSTDNTDVKEAAELVIAYLSVPLKILDDTYAPPNIVSDVVSRELELVLIKKPPEEMSPIFNYKEDYSQYIPRGHYTTSEKLKRYFMAMMWLGRMRLELKNPLNQVQADKQTKAAILLTYIISTGRVDDEYLINTWEKIYLPTAYIVGFSDDLTFYDYINGIMDVYGNFTIDMLSDTKKLDEFQDVMMKRDNSKIKNTIWTVDTASSLPGLRFMGQRFILDGYIHQMLCYPSIPFRTMVKGLDIAAVFGSKEALKYLREDIQRYPKYNESIENITEYISSLPDGYWWSTLYNGWLYIVKAELSTFNSSYPAYMNTTAWLDKSLNTALASWAQLRHDTILYAKQPYAAKTAVPPSPPDVGYVEPIPEVYHRLSILINNTENGLSKLGLLDSMMKGKLDSLYTISSKLLDISLKELSNISISDEDAVFIKSIPYLFRKILNFGKDELSDPRVIADVFTDPNTNRVLEVGTGYFDLILVIYTGRDGGLYISVGLVMSYHEFTWPIKNRLTDQEWRTMLEQNSTRGIQSWVYNYEYPATS